MSDQTHRGACFCERVVVEVTGTPAFMGFCHCESCRTWLGAPIHAATLWPTDAVRVVEGEELLATYQKTERSHRKHCTACGGHVMNAHPGGGMIDVLAPILRDFPFAPTLHVHYGEHVLAMRDGLPKYRDMPADLGGSGELVEED
ncbi:MAG TPA: GFA family protein [Myxococcota bacterium]|nr:GFA family protein [Myxococcota bacterium]